MNTDSVRRSPGASGVAPMRRGSARWPWAMAVGAAVMAMSLGADAQPLRGAERFALRIEGGAGLSTSSQQRHQLGYDSVVGDLNVRIGFNALEWLSPQISMHNGFFGTSLQSLNMGRTMAFQGGLRIEPWIGSVGRIWIDGNAGVVLTGPLTRFGFDVGVGFEFVPVRWLGLGPYARYHDVLRSESAHEVSDAAWMTFGVALTFRLPRSGPPLTDRDGDGVYDDEDQCVTVPRGEHPDENRLGCPLLDTDSDGVFDHEDQCVNVPRGEHPDPRRTGCPRVDTDNDGVYDDEDQCVSVPQGDRPNPQRRGCPDADTDHDGVFDSQDQCPQVPQGLRPDPSRTGCPLADRDSDTVIDPEDRCVDVPGDPANHGCPGRVVTRGGRIETPPVFFATNRDVVLRRSHSVLEAVANVLRGVPAIRRVSIEGHTDDQNDDASNLDLSNRRAHNVMQWLVSHGVEATRLEAHGFGETRPLRPIDGLRGRALRSARATNRRVEFRITDPPMPPTVSQQTATELHIPEAAPPPRSGRHHRRSGHRRRRH